MEAPSLLSRSPTLPRSGPAVTRNTAGKCGCSRNRRKSPGHGPTRGAGAGTRRSGSLTGRGEQRQQQESRDRPAPQPPHGSLIILRVRGLRLRAARGGREEKREGEGRGRAAPAARGAGVRAGRGSRVGGAGLSELWLWPSRRGRRAGLRGERRARELWARPPPPSRGPGHRCGRTKGAPPGDPSSRHSLSRCTPSCDPSATTSSLKDLQPVDWQVEAGRVKRVVSNNSAKSRLGNWVWGVADDPGAPPGLSTLEWGTPAPVPLLTEGCSIW